MPDLGIEDQGIRVLHDPVYPYRYAISPPLSPMHGQPEQIPMLNAVSGQHQFPVSIVGGLQFPFRGFFPSGKLTDQKYPGGIGGPFAEDPLLIQAVQAIV